MKLLKIVCSVLLVVLFYSCKEVHMGQITFAPSEMNTSKSIELNLAKNQKIQFVSIHKATYTSKASLNVHIAVYYKDRLVRKYDAPYVNNSLLSGSSAGKDWFKEDVFELPGTYRFTVTPTCSGNIEVTQLEIKINKK